ncbi:MAG TPA: cold shock domain-containing protein [Phycisphaerales bacterium]|nr:cold shock domain-containing protein [Phycisphaerales bacterium]
MANILFEGTATVKWYDKLKGFGYVVYEDNKEAFFHRTAIRLPDNQLPYETQSVQVRIIDAERGPRCVIVEAAR